jgi:hypothetical protein
MSYESGKIYAIPIADFYVTAPPVWEPKYPNGRNWLAILTENPEVAGGIGREWIERGKGRFKYNVTRVIEGDLIEFGADYMYSSGRRIPSRWCGEVVEFTETEMRVRYYADVKELFEMVHERESRLQETAP